MKNMLLFGISTLALVFAPQSTPAPQLFQRPSLATACWTLKLASNTNHQLVPIDAYTWQIKFTANGDKFIARFLSGPEANIANTVGHFEAAVLKGQSVFYVPMYQSGQSPSNFSPTANAYETVLAGIADSATHITGTWIDMRGSMNQNDINHDGGQAQITGERSILLPIGSGWYTMENTPCPTGSTTQ